VGTLARTWSWAPLTCLWQLWELNPCHHDQVVCHHDQVVCLSCPSNDPPDCCGLTVDSIGSWIIWIPWYYWSKISVISFCHLTVLFRVYSDKKPHPSYLSVRICTGARRSCRWILPAVRLQLTVNEQGYCVSGISIAFYCATVISQHFHRAFVVRYPEEWIDLHKWNSGFISLMLMLMLALVLDTEQCVWRGWTVTTSLQPLKTHVPAYILYFRYIRTVYFTVDLLLPPSENLSGVPYISVSDNISGFHTDVKSNSVIV
jgi:hypothetical protein